MSIPKLKVYRLNNNYSEDGDDDIQSISKDQLIPVVPKDINVFDSQQMVGIEQKGDTRLVVQSDWNTQVFAMNLSSDNLSQNIMQTEEINCDGWVLGKGNFKVLVKIFDITDSSLENGDLKGGLYKNQDVITYVKSQDTIYNEENHWFEIDPKFWDYEVEDYKRYCGRNNGNWQELQSADINNTQYVYQYSKIKFKLGNLLIKSNFYFGNTYSSKYLQIFSAVDDTKSAQNIDYSVNKIVIKYKKYCEFGDDVDFDNGVNKFDYNSTSHNIYYYTSDLTDENYYINDNKNSDNKSNLSKFRVPFGQIYNGTRTGRCLYYQLTQNSVNTYNCSTELPDDATLVKTRRSYYEGNYLYNKRVFPLRCYVAHEFIDNNGVQTDNADDTFAADFKIIDGSCTFTGITSDWYVDGIMAPVVMQRIIVDGGDTNYQRKIFKKLEQGTQITTALSTVNGTYKVSFNSKFYKIGMEGNQTKYCYPKQIFLFFNKQDDTLENLFDFNYNYAYFCDATVGIDSSVLNNHQSRMLPFENANLTSYGYQNRGILYSSNNNNDIDINSASVIFGLYGESGSQYNNVYKKKERLAVLNDFGYDKTKDFLMEKITDPDANPEITDNIINTVYHKIIIPDQIQISDNNYQDVNFENKLLFKIYIDGILYWSGKYFDAIENDNQNLNKYKIIFSYENNQNVIKIYAANGIELPKDVMIAYYERHKIDNKKDSNNKNPWCIGFRIPCYQKVKTANLFVSSFPNWVKGHLNNDLDVFVGNTTYSGTTVSNTSTEGIYPKYQSDGWQALYTYGAIQFTDAITEIDYFDLFNYLSTTYNITINDYDTLGKSDCNQNYPANETCLKSYLIYYNKVRYSVAHYDGIYSAFRAKMSNYTIQNGGASYKLLEDNDYEYAYNKKWVSRSDTNLKLVYESGGEILPQILYSNESEKQVASALTQINVTNSNVFVTINTDDDRIKVISYTPSYTLINGEQVDQGFVICLHESITEINQYASIDKIDNDYLRLHVALGKSYINEDSESLFVGVENGTQKNISQITETKYFFPFVRHDIDGYVDVNWYQLPPMQDVYTTDNISSIDDVQLNAVNIGDSDTQNNNRDDIIMRRYRYHNSDWYYDIFVQVFSYRYNINNSQVYVDKKTPISKVEFIIYRVSN